ncbi:MAG: PepSY domain-containing protein [Ramlibacter sp.]|nr:PepSY domain-containing protein [Ramlibacter sp.]
MAAVLTRRSRFLVSALCASLCAACLLAASPAWADVGRDEAAAVARQVTGGRVLSVDRARAGDRPAWRVKLVTAGGEVRVVLIDAATGRPM